MKKPKANFKILSHIADLKIMATGKNNKELFLNMLKGLNSVMAAKIKSKDSKKRKITIKSSELKTLLVDFLNEILYQSQTNKEVYNNILFDKFNQNEIKADLIGQPVISFGQDIKAATYHDLELFKNKDGLLQAGVLFDI